MDTLFRDLRQSFRALSRAPGVTASVLVALALGIGVNTAVFSVVYAVLLRPLPIRDSGRIAVVALDSKKINAFGVQPGLSVYGTLLDSGTWFDSLAAAASVLTTATSAGQEVHIRFSRVSQSYLPTLGVSPMLGRNFLPEEDRPGAGRVALISHDWWRGRMNADPRALGTEVVVEGQPFTVVGVLPHGFHVDGRPADIYAPIARSLNSREELRVDIYAHLKPGVSFQTAQAEVSAREKDRVRGPLGWETKVWPVREYQVRDIRRSLWILLGAVCLVLLIACANTATLLLARATARRREIALRASLGAGRADLLRRFLTESAVLALLGGICGAGLAALCVRVIPILAHERLPGLIEQTRLDGAVLAFTFLISLFAGLLFGAAPALLTGRVDVIETLKQGGRAGHGVAHRRGWNTLVITETALALIRAAGAGLLVSTFFYLRDVAPGFRVDGLLTARAAPPPKRFTSREQANQYWRAVIAKVRSIPGVRTASFAQSLPLTGDHQILKWPIEGHHFARPEDYPVLYLRLVETEYFRVMQLPLRRGRLFNDRDTTAAPKVILVNETLARRFWPGENPIGKHIGGGAEPAFQVIGVVADVRLEDTIKAAPPEVYFHFLQLPPGRTAFAIRTDPHFFSTPIACEPALRQAIAALDPSLAITHAAEMSQVISDRIAPNRLSAQLMAVFAGLALILAAVGVYGVLSFSVAQRTHEIGVRTAMGATRARVISMVVREAVQLCAAGVAIGLACSFALTRLARGLLYGVTSTDPAAHAAAALVMAVIAVAASLAPAIRAAGVDPLIALRDE